MKRSRWLTLGLAVFACDAFREPPEFEVSPSVFGSGGSFSTTSCGNYTGPEFSVYEPFRRDLYAWLNAEQVTAIVASELPLLERQQLSTTLLDDFQLDVFDDFGSAAPPEVRIKQAILGDEQHVLPTWPLPFASFRETDPPRDQLVQIQLREEAWILVIYGGKSFVYDANNQQVEFEVVVKEPWRLAGAYGTHSSISRQELAEQGSTPRPAESCNVVGAPPLVEVGERAFFLTNPLMVESWSVNADESFQELAREKSKLADYLEQMRTLNEPTITTVSLPCLWTQYDKFSSGAAPASCVIDYLSSLNSTDALFVPTVRNFVRLLDALGDIKPGDSVYFAGPDLVVPTGGVGGAPGNE